MSHGPGGVLFGQVHSAKPADDCNILMEAVMLIPTIADWGDGFCYLQSSTKAMRLCWVAASQCTQMLYRNIQMMHPDKHPATHLSYGNGKCVCAEHAMTKDEKHTALSPEVATRRRAVGMKTQSVTQAGPFTMVRLRERSAGDQSLQEASWQSKR